MATEDRRIICRQCGETISKDVGSCPHCGAEIRGKRGPIAAIVVALVIIIPTITQLESLWPFTALGVILGFGGVYFLYDQWRRIQV